MPIEIFELVVKVAVKHPETLDNKTLSKQKLPFTVASFSNPLETRVQQVLDILKMKNQRFAQI